MLEDFIHDVFVLGNMMTVIVEDGLLLSVWAVLVVLVQIINIVNRVREDMLVQVTIDNVNIVGGRCWVYVVVIVVDG